MPKKIFEKQEFHLFILQSSEPREAINQDGGRWITATSQRTQSSLNSQRFKFTRRARFPGVKSNLHFQTSPSVRARRPSSPRPPPPPLPPLPPVLVAFRLGLGTCFLFCSCCCCWELGGARRTGAGWIGVVVGGEMLF